VEKGTIINNLVISVQAVIPMFCLLLIGVFVKKSKILTDRELPQVNNLVFRIFLPVLMFSSIYDSKISGAMNSGLILFALAAVLFVYFGALAFSFFIEKNNAARGSLVQAIYRSNLVIMGLPLVSGIYGHKSLGTVAVMVSVIVPVYNVLAVITLEIFRGQKTSWGKVITGILKNPLIIGGAAGMLAVLLQVRLPDVIEEIVTETAGAATPLALIVLGASFHYSSIDRCRRNLVICVASRLVAVPGVCLAAAAALGFRDVEFVTLIAVFASPCSVSSFTMAQQMDSDSELTANCIAFTTALASLTMFLWIFLFKQLGMV
jgi:predicted permease